MHPVWHFLLLLHHAPPAQNLSISAQHVPGLHNPIAYCLTLFHMQAFYRRCSPTQPNLPTSIYREMTWDLHQSLAPTNCSSYSFAAHSFQFCGTHNCPPKMTSSYHHPSSPLCSMPPTSAAPRIPSKSKCNYIYLYRVHTLHPDWGLPNPLEGALRLRLLLQGIKHVQGCRPDSRLPIKVFQFLPATPSPRSPYPVGSTTHSLL